MSGFVTGRWPPFSPITDMRAKTLYKHFLKLADKEQEEFARLFLEEEDVKNALTRQIGEMTAALLQKITSMEAEVKIMRDNTLIEPCAWTITTSR
jgi:hypothetical protein